MVLFGTCLLRLFDELLGLHVFWFGCLVFIVCIVLVWLFVFRWLLVVLNLVVVL